MRHELHRVAAIFVFVVGVSRLDAASSTNKQLIQDAFCGKENSESVRARALDVPDLTKLPDDWRKLKKAEVELWLNIPRCSAPPDVTKAVHRRQLLEQLQQRLARAQELELVDAALTEFRGWQPPADAWPSAAECPGCAALRSAEEALITAARSSRRKPVPDQLGATLDAATERGKLIAPVCAAMPSSAAREEIEKRFRYYSWTASGARLLDVAAWFERPEVVAACKSR